MEANAVSKSPLKIMVLAGGPDREREVSLKSGATVTASLKAAGHDVIQRDIGPYNLGALDEFASWKGDVIFPVLHGSWGEGGPLQRILEARGIKFTTCRSAAAELCMDKHQAKLRLIEHGLPTPNFEYVAAGEPGKIKAPAVVKAPREGSSFDLVICRTDEALAKARADLETRHPRLLIEQFVKGKELTVGVIQDSGGLRTLPPIHIIPATEYYDFDAKYDRNDTQYLFKIDLPATALTEIKRIALEAAKAAGVRHMCRIDIIVDPENRPWILEINTIPGFTDHSLLPKAAKEAGISLPDLVDGFARSALRD